ncbi:MAG: ABC-2 type transport system ATP-binding protein, partial [Woeseiaceae bacterium]
NDLFELLNREKIKVLSLRNKSNRLEELFMRLVHSKNDISKENS